MRTNIVLLLALAALPAFIVGSSAFSAVDMETRLLSVQVVGDASAFLSVGPNSASPHDCLVKESATKVYVKFGSTDTNCEKHGGGTGVNRGDAAIGTGKYARYSFHDILLVTNKGTRSVVLFVNATTTTGGGTSVEVAKKTTSGGMTDSDYYTASLSTLTLPVTPVAGKAYIGLRINGSTVATGNVTGTVEIMARGEP